jgi:hypothetical protein
MSVGTWLASADIFLNGMICRSSTVPRCFFVKDSGQEGMNHGLLRDCYSHDDLQLNVHTFIYK